jgi:tRNA threonylcarbamoyladenosine biosynthesis protein TsaE
MENTNFKKTSRSEEETKNIGYDFSKDLADGDIVLLYGELGAGKTAFVKGIAKQKNAEDVTSPTFTIINEYEGDRTIYHMDLYRI